MVEPLGSRAVPPTPPRNNPIDVTEVTYDEYIRNLPKGFTPYALEDFLKLSGRDDIRQRLNKSNEVWEVDYSRYMQQQDAYQRSQNYQQAQANVQKEFKTFTDNLALAGVTSTSNRANWANIAQYSVRLLNTSGDDEDARAARTTAAIILQQYEEQLAPYLTQGLEDPAAIQARIDAAIQEYEDSRSFKDKTIGFIGSVLGSDVVQGALDPFDKPYQAIPRAIAPWATDNTLSTGDKLLASAGGATASLASGMWELADVATLGSLPESEEIDLIDVQKWGHLRDNEGNPVTFDTNLDGRVSYREAMGQAADQGGIKSDIAELVLETIGDPTTYIGIGVVGRAKKLKDILKGAASAGDVAPMTRKAATKMVNGASFDSLSEIEQHAIREVIYEAQASAISTLKDRKVWSQLYRTNPDDAIRATRNSLARTAAAREALLRSRIDRASRTLSRGLNPSVRFAGRQVMDLTPIYNALHLVDSALQYEEAWTSVLRPLVDLESPDELVEFFHRFDPEALYDANAVERLRGWVSVQAMFDTVTPEGQRAVDNLMTGAPHKGQAWSEFREFIETITGRNMSEWDRYYSEKWGRFDGAVEDMNRPATPTPTPWTGDQLEIDFDAPRDPVQGSLDDLLPKAPAAQVDDIVEPAIPQADDVLPQVGDTLPSYSQRALDLFPQEGAVVEEGGQVAMTFADEVKRVRELPPMPPEDTALGGAGSNTAVRQLSMFPDLDVTQLRQATSLDPDEWRRLGAAVEQGRLFGDALHDPIVVNTWNRLSDFSKQVVRSNLEIITDLEHWVPATFAPRGLRSLNRREDIIGRFTRMFEHLSPRSRVRAAMGERVAETLDTAMARTAIKNFYEDNIHMLGIGPDGSSPLFEAAAREMGLSVRDTLAEVGRIAAQTHDMDEIFTAVEAAGGGDAMQLLARRVNGIRLQTLQLSIVSGWDAEVLLGRQGYMPRVMTQELQTLIERARYQNDTQVLDALERIGVPRTTEIMNNPINPLLQGGHALRRTFMSNVEDIDTLNSAARRQLRQAGLTIDSGFRMYEDNPVRATLLRSKSAHLAHAWINMMQELADQVDDAGRPLAYMSPGPISNIQTSIAIAGDDAIYGAREFVTHELPNGGFYQVRRELYDEVMSVNRVMNTQRFKSDFTRAMDKASGIWGGLATVPISPNMGFHQRNQVGNLLNMIVGGFKDPANLVVGYRLRRQLHQIRRYMEDNTLNFLDSMEAVVPDSRQQELILAARERGVIGGGQIVDLFDTRDFLAGEPPGRLSSINPASSQFAPTRLGRQLGSLIEETNRMAMFVDAVEQGNSFDTAAQLVRKYLIDYTDLTGFESQTMRLINRFYTFTARNTALQVGLMVHQPAKVYRAQEFATLYASMVLGVLGWDGTEQDVVPGETTPGGMRWPDYVSNNLRYYAGRSEADGGVIAGIDTPFTSAQDTLGQLASIAKVPIIYGLNTTTEPGSLAEMDSYNDLGKEVRNALGLVAGSPAEVLQLTAELATGKDTFTGADLNDVDKTFLDKVFRVVDTVLPLSNKSVGEWEKWNDQGLGRAASALFGLTVAPHGSEEQRDTAMASLSYEVRAGLREAQNNYEGEDLAREIPTWDELMEAGSIKTRNDVVWFIMRSVARDGTLSVDDLAKVRDYIPREVLDASGLQSPNRNQTKESVADRAERVRNMAEAIRLYGVDVTDEMINNMILRESGLSVGDLYDLGIEKPFKSNPYIDKPSEDPAERQARQQETLEELAKVFGVPLQELQEQAPLLQAAQRKANQMQDAGYSHQEIVAELISEMSRTKRGLLFGDDSLEPFRAYTPLTVEDQIEFARKAEAAETELRVMMMLVAGRSPTQDELSKWLREVLLTGPEIENLGDENYRAPSRENVTPDEVYDQRLMQKVQAVPDLLPGADYLASFGE